MKTIWPAATLAIAITGYFAWSNSATPPAPQLLIDDCHRLAGEVAAIHSSGGTIPPERLSTARGCAVSFGQNWAADTSSWAQGLRAEGAMRVQ
jgi:hypothetical protein